jgi:hypothetical protein
MVVNLLADSGWIRICLNPDGAKRRQASGQGPAAFSISFVVSESPPKIIEALQTIREARTFR